MLNKLDSDLQSSISSNMMISTIVNIVEACKGSAIEELESILSNKG